MSKQKDVIDAVWAMINRDSKENLLASQIEGYSDQLGNELMREEMMAKLQTILHKLGKDAHLEEDTPERRQARRVLYTVLADLGSHQDPDYRKLVNEVKP
jgi:hypothetical protein